MAVRAKSRAERRPLPVAPPPAPPAAASARPHALMLGGVFAATALLYLRALGNGFVYDDRVKIRVNDYIGQWSFLWRSLFHDEWWFQGSLQVAQSSRYRPLSDIWFGLNFHLFGFSAIGWHAAGLIVHLVAVYLVFRLAAHLTDERRVALLAGLIFAVMPVHAQTVVWVSAIGLLLTAALELGAFCLFISRARSRLRWPLVLALYAGALLSHESAVAFPGLVGLYVLLLEAPGGAKEGQFQSGPLLPRFKRALLSSAPFMAAMMTYMVARRLVLGVFISSSKDVLHEISRARILMTVPRALLSELVYMIVPSTAGLAHRQLFATSPQSVFFVVTPASLDFWGPVVVLGGLAAIFLRLLRGHPRRRLYLFCAGWMLIAVLPMMNLGAIIYTLEIQDDYLYLASVGWCVMFADWFMRFAREARPALRKPAWAAMAALVAVYAGALWSVERVWHDNRALFARCTQVIPESPLCHQGLGVALKLGGRFADAEREFTEATRLYPPLKPIVLAELAETHGRQGRFAQAAEELAEAIPGLNSPTAGTFVTLAEFYDLSRQPEKSEEALRRAESLPDGAESAGLGRAQIRMFHGDSAGAATILESLVKRYPGDYDAWSELGAALADQKRYQEALTAYRRMAELDPTDPEPQFFTARVLHSMGRDREALEHCRAALKIEPNDGDTQALMREIERSLR